VSADHGADRSPVAAKAMHPSAHHGGQSRDERHLVLVKPTPPPVTPEAWSAGLWGSFA